MHHRKTWLTCKEAADILGYTQRHILNIIKKGKISATRDESGKFIIDKSEFFRVYPHDTIDEASGTDPKPLEESGKKALEEKIKHLEEMVKEKNKVNEFLIEQISNFTYEKTKMLEAITCHSRLLEYKEKTVEVKLEQNVLNKKSKWWRLI